MSRWEGRLRSLLLALALLSFAGIALELWFEDHDQEFLQLVPFGICALGVASIAAVLIKPASVTIWLMRALMVAAVGVSVLGLWEHLESNYGFERDIRPTASTTTVLWHALHGSAPALAPGSLALIAVMAAGATLGHPALAQGSRVRMTAPLPTPVSTKETSTSGT
ncbi:MAG TPA: hypothetical protein VJB57_08745 [Dehalococcoidia bacterium]|nr:hypothetical protein [Dehalococcoidia bacterium]